MKNITVLGAGGWGLALALSLNANGHKVTVWSPFADEVQNLNEKRTNEKLLTGIIIPNSINITTDLSVCQNNDITVIATPSFAVKETAQKLKSVKPNGIVVNVAKGFENKTLMRLSQVIESELPNADIMVLSGPSHAEEVARKIPTMLTVSGKNEQVCKTVQEVFSSDILRVYTNPDTIGVELGGALKNVIAVAAGVCDGMGLGDNSKAALITRGLAEMSRLGEKLGAKAATFAGLTGLGDLVVTCTSTHSRNHRFGELVGKGYTVEDALNIVGTVEGYYACKSAYQLAQKHGVDTPIIELSHKLLYEEYPVEDIVKTLMQRPFKEE
ncbi:MAG: NAD(P)-dependent glycerol-3-phosphate dehydrogenase [Clostridia bacterium]|nr:NAD(P)-dependent glycerol-3-phosphate dehydrogenase [Clostridia bacterium]